MGHETKGDAPPLSLFSGPSEPPLLTVTLADFLDEQCLRFGDKEALIVPWTGDRWTYNDIKNHSLVVAGYLLSCGVRPGDRVAILAGNRKEYASVFFACMRIGATLVILNNTYTFPEAIRALQHSESKILFASPTIGRTDNLALLTQINNGNSSTPSVQQVITIGGNAAGLIDYDDVFNDATHFSNDEIRQLQGRISPYETCNLQFTSGSTGQPKAAMLTHYGLLNNSRFIGDRMRLTPKDVLCCPPPLFHCFGLVLGLLAVLTHGAKIVHPSDVFDGPSVLQAITDEKCTAIHGVPTMFDTLFSLPRPKTFDSSNLRTGIIAGAPVPRHIMEKLVGDFGMTEFTSSYGLTEASPTCFNSFVDERMEYKLGTVGTLMPHAHGKIVDREGKVVPVGTRGELCIAGYQLQLGYWRNAEKTAEAMKKDANGIIWLHTGDEAVFDAEGYCTITGRFKDIIIRGGENIYPLEIEERLCELESVDRAIVVGLPDQRYGEVPVAFLQRSEGHERLSDDAIRDWVRKTLGRHKAPMHVFWLGENGVSDEVPVTGSGKIKKFEMQQLGKTLLQAEPKARL